MEARVCLSDFRLGWRVGRVGGAGPLHVLKTAPHSKGQLGRSATYSQTLASGPASSGP